MTEAVKVRPFLIGIVDGGLTNEIIKQLEKYLEGYPICTDQCQTIIKIYLRKIVLVKLII